MTDKELIKILDWIEKWIKSNYENKIKFADEDDEINWDLGLQYLSSYIQDKKNILFSKDKE